MVVLVLEAGQTWPETLSELFLALLCHWYSVLSLEEHCTHLGTYSRPSIDITVCALRWTKPIPCITQTWALRIQNLVNIDAVGKLCSTLLGRSQEAPSFFLPINKACKTRQTGAQTVWLEELILAGRSENIRIVEEKNWFQGQEPWILILALSLTMTTATPLHLFPPFSSKGSSSPKASAVCHNKFKSEIRAVDTL